MQYWQKLVLIYFSGLMTIWISWVIIFTFPVLENLGLSLERGMTLVQHDYNRIFSNMTWLLGRGFYAPQHNILSAASLDIFLERKDSSFLDYCIFTIYLKHVYVCIYVYKCRYGRSKGNGSLCFLGYQPWIRQCHGSMSLTEMLSDTSSSASSRGSKEEWEREGGTVRD